MTKLKWVLGLLLIVGLLVVMVGCTATESRKVTGGGWFTNYAEPFTIDTNQYTTTNPGDRITLGFTAQPTNTDGAAKGELQLIDHTTGTIIHGTFNVDVKVFDPAWSDYDGTATINGEPGHTLKVAFNPTLTSPILAGKFAAIVVDFGQSDQLIYGGVIQGGNITIHQK